MSGPVTVYREILAAIALESSGFIIGCSQPEWVAVSVLPCSDIKTAEAACPAAFFVIGRFGTSINDDKGLYCCCKNDSYHWTLNGLSTEPVFKDQNPFADFIVLFTSISKDVASRVTNPKFCRVIDEIIEADSATPCQKFLPKKCNPAESLAHPFAFQAMHRVLPIDILLPSSPEIIAAAQLAFSKTVQQDLVDVMIIVRTDLSFASAFQLLLSEMRRIAAIPQLREHHYYCLPKVHIPISVPETIGGSTISVALNHRLSSRQALCFTCCWTKGQRLFNVHRFVRPSGLVESTAHVVNGAYAYYHYLQDGFIDDGWGCAYRSLQTIWSWALYQGYINEPVPDFREIQKIICESDDKPKNFIGSRQWIGAIEVNYALASVGILCKILPLNSGAEFATKGRELALHFEIHGSPVMIGGGVLAYTLLGVDINNFTGDVRFLILDPHYKGDDDIDVIIKNGWCAWRSSDLFDQTAFYNLCMPQKPTVQNHDICL